MSYVVVARHRTEEGEENTALPLVDTMAAASRQEPGDLDVLRRAPRPEVRA
ncbi:hypothetical protein [Streptomyces sp. NPDC050388]|uniref:hypothetical protein n=1 Tax=Streptomyces sp. NPDC050388 TaxID=3155781 RepID=UPI003440E5E0